MEIADLMATATTSRPSFSPWHKWRIGFNVVLVILVVFSVVVMVNYLSQTYFLRWQLSTRTKIQLSPLTVNLVESLTNQVKVTIFYDTAEDPFYSTVADLLKQYARRSSRISVQTVDYIRDPGAAQKVKTEYNLGTVTDKNIIIFSNEKGPQAAGQEQRKVMIVPGDKLNHYAFEIDPTAKERTFKHKATEFLGEQLFTGALLAITGPPFKAYFLQGHGEPDIDDGSELGFMKLKAVLGQNCISAESLLLADTNAVPADCNLLVVAGATLPMLEGQLQKIDQYLSQGGRLLALFSTMSLERATGREKTGLDKVLANWGVAVGNTIIEDPPHSPSGADKDMLVGNFDLKQPIVTPLVKERTYLYLIRPRAIGRLQSATPAADAPHVEEIALSGPDSFAMSNPARKQAFPLMVAVEKGAIKNVITERGSTRIVVAGDSTFLGNVCIDSAANRDFAGYAVNWLLDRTQLLQGVGPRPIEAYQIRMTAGQMQSVELILLAALPGAALFLGGLVWLCRRK